MAAVHLFIGRSATAAISIVAFGLSLLLICPLRAQCPDMDLTPPMTFVLIDRSGSMGEIPKSWANNDQLRERTPWQAVRTRIQELFSKLPRESVTQIALFRDMGPQADEARVSWFESFSVADSAAVQKSLEELDKLTPRDNKQSTPLFDSIIEAIEQARLLSAEDATRDISLVIYTDGADSTPLGPDRDLKLKQIREKFAELVETNENVWLYYTPILEGQTIKKILDHPHAVEVGFRFPLPLLFDRTSFVLENAKLNLIHTISPFLCANESVWPLLRGKQLAFVFEPDSGQTIEVEADPVDIKQGQLDIALVIKNAATLDATQAYSGFLNIQYPNIADYELRAPPRLRVRWQAAREPEIVNLSPASGTVVATEVPQTFTIQTLQGATVQWDFGDGQSAIGTDVRHTYHTAGQRTVTVSVIGTNGVSARPRTVDLSVVDLSVGIQPIDPPTIEGLPTRLAISKVGPVERTEWLVDGKRYQPSNADGTLMFPFTAGEHHVQALGFASQTVVRSDEIAIEVIAKPIVKVSPAECRPGREIQFSIDAPSGFDRVLWRIADVELRGGTAQTYRPERSGPLHVEATLEDSSQRTIVLEPLDITVGNDPPKPKIDLGKRRAKSAGNSKSDDEAANSSASENSGSKQTGAIRFWLNETLPLVNAGAGDIRESRWSVKKPGEQDFSELPREVTTIALDELGQWSFRLEVWGWPDENGKVQQGLDTVEFVVSPRPNHAIFWVPTIMLTIVLGYVGWCLLIGNAPRHWSLYHRFETRPDPTKEVPFRLSRKGIWDWRRKHARLPLHLFTAKGYWTEKAGRGEFIEIKRLSGGSGPIGNIAYSGESTTGARLGKVTKISENANSTIAKIVESRMPEGKQTVYFELKKTGGSELLPRLAFALTVATWSILIACLYRWVYGL